MPWIGIKDATENHGRVLKDTFQHTNELGIANSSARILPTNTVCLSRTASVGRVVVMGKPMATSQDFVNWVCSEAIDYRFLKYVFLAEQSAFLRFASGTTHQTIYFPEVKAFHVCLPPQPEQRAIAQILGTLDDKIELNRRTNEALEEMVQAIFKSWFVDFNPVRAKAERRDSGLPEHITDLFPDRFEDSDLGEIPKGWPLTPLNEVLTAKNDRVGESYVPEYSSTNEGLQLRSERFKKKLSASTSKNKLIRQGDLVFGLSRRILNFGLMRDVIGCVSPAYKVFAIDQSAVVPDFLERTIRMRSSYFYAAISASSREGQSVSIDGLGRLKFVRPEPALQRMFYRVTEPIHARIKSLQSETLVLSTIRDTLLPRLISGELRVPDAKHIVDEAGP